MDLEEILGFDRVAITGQSASGKTTLAMNMVDRPMFHTDDYRDMPWGNQPVELIKAIGDLDKFVIEGVTVPRLLKRGLQIDLLIILTKPNYVLTKNEEKLWKNMQPSLRRWLLSNKTTRVERW